jgi:hypothetical protein
LPAGFIFQSFDAASQVTAANSTAVPSTGATGNIIFEGGVVSAGNTSYYIPAGGSLIVKYNTLSASASASNLITTAKDYVAATEVGSAQNTVSVSSTLPVSLVSFKAGWSNKKAKLEWVTANEINSGSFEIERSSNNGSFIKIGTVNASGGSSAVQNYLFIDSFPKPGVNKYRLKLIDQDGQYKYSSVITLIDKPAGIVIEKIYPNPFVNHIVISISSAAKQPVILKLSDIAGNILFSWNKLCQSGSNSFVLDKLNNLQAGIYFLKLIIPGEYTSLKLVKTE